MGFSIFPFVALLLQCCNFNCDQVAEMRLEMRSSFLYGKEQESCLEWHGNLEKKITPTLNLFISGCYQTFKG